MDRSYLITNAFYLAVVRHVDEGIRIKALKHALVDKPDVLLLDGATSIFDICLDESNTVHLVYLNCEQYLTHAILDPQTFTVSSHTIDTSKSQISKLTDIKVSYHARQLHLVLSYPYSIEHRECSAGFVWSDPNVIVTEEECDFVQLQVGIKGNMYLGFVKKKENSTQFYLLKYIWDIKEWIHEGIIFELKGEGSLFPFMIIDGEKQFHIIIQHFLLNKLHIYYNVINLQKQKEWSKEWSVQETIRLPLEKVDDATFNMNITGLHLSWLSKGFIYKLSYNLYTNRWGSLKTGKTKNVSKWIVIPKKIGLSTPYLFSDSFNLINLEEQLELGLNNEPFDLDFHYLFLLGDRISSTAFEQLHEKQRVLIQQKRLQQLEEEWQQRIIAKKKKIAVLRETLP